MRTIRRNALRLIDLLAIILCATSWATWANAKEYYGVELPAGDQSFADGLIRFVPGENVSNQAGTAVLGPPASYASLGSGGFIDVAFIDNWISNSGDAEPDLISFEVSGSAEAIYFALRPTPETAELLGPRLDANMDGFLDVDNLLGVPDKFKIGFITQLDIDQYFPGFAENQLFFDAVQIMDDPEHGPTSGSPTVGYDMLAVGAIRSVPNPNYTVGDFDLDGTLDTDDLNQFTSPVFRGDFNPLYDLDRSATNDRRDRTEWIHGLKRTYFGDANLDGLFDSSDLVTVFAAGKYELATGGITTWEEGDWNGDRMFDTSDLVEAFGDGGYDAGPRPIAAVPEPTNQNLIAIAFASLARWCYRRRDESRA